MQSTDPLTATPEQIERLEMVPRPLLDWYGRSARVLPWRQDPTPYHIWVSEIMLQQTRVEAARGYYIRFLEALPTVESLAETSEDTLLKLWQGLGYYNRARNLQKAARVLLRQFDGRLPASYHALLTLPGIGEYTAGAIASIAFGIPVPAVDGNVLRVCSRLLASYADISLPAVKRSFRQLLLGALPPARPGDFNQALMDLGASICIPGTGPLCGRCPLSELCSAHIQEVAGDLPVKAPKKARRVEEHTILVVIAGYRTLLFRRSEGLLSGMFEPLNLEGALTPKQAEEALRERGLSPSKLISLRASKHLFTHVEWRMTGYLAHADPVPAPEGALWADKRQLERDYALPSAFRAYTRELPIR